MKVFDNIPNSQIKEAINRAYKSEKNRNVLNDRIIGGMTYDDLAEKHYPESAWFGRRDYLALLHKMQKMVEKVWRELSRERR